VSSRRSDHEEGGSVKTTILALACASSRLVAAAPGRATIER
jgi:hypothetical protein